MDQKWAAKHGSRRPANRPGPSVAARANTANASRAPTSSNASNGNSSAARASCACCQRPPALSCGLPAPHPHPCLRSGQGMARRPRLSRHAAPARSPQVLPPTRRINCSPEPRSIGQITPIIHLLPSLLDPPALLNLLVDGRAGALPTLDEQLRAFLPLWKTSRVLRRSII